MIRQFLFQVVVGIHLKFAKLPTSKGLLALIEFFV